MEGFFKNATTWPQILRHSVSCSKNDLWHFHLKTCKDRDDQLLGTLDESILDYMEKPFGLK